MIIFLNKNHPNIMKININNRDKILIKIYNILGQETEEIPNTLLFYHYSDGTIEKKIIME